MKTKKLNLAQRILLAKWHIEYAQKELKDDLLKFGVKSASVEWDLLHIEQWSRYLRNTCEMHDLEYKLV